MACQQIRSELRLGAKACRLPVQEKAVRGSGRSGQLCRENSNEDIGAFDEVCAAGDHHRRADFSFLCASKHANHDIAWPQRDSSDSSTSSRLSEAALKSSRSSSDQESDQSILQFGVSVANRSASAESSAAASGGRRRKAFTSDASRGFNCISMALLSV